MTQVEQIPVHKIGDLRSRVLGLLGRGVSRSEIGSMAIEAMLIRDLVENIEEEGKTSKELREAIHELRNIEKTIISLYMMTPSGKKESSRTRMFELYTYPYRPYHAGDER